MTAAAPQSRGSTRPEMGVTAGKARQHAENQKPKLWTRAGTEPQPGWGNTTPPLHTGGAYAVAAWDFCPGSRSMPCGRFPKSKSKKE